MAHLVYKNCNINYTSQGSGKAVVLLHGFLENISMWDQIRPSFLENNRIISIDLLGHGKTDNLGYIHTMEDQANMVKYVMDHLNIKRYILIGHSMGGYISLALAELFPESILGLCLMNSSALPDSKETKINRDRSVKAVQKYPDTFIRIAIPNLFSKDNQSKLRTEIKQITVEALQISQQGIIACLEGMKVRKDRTFIYRTAHFPIQMIIGKQDPALDYDSLIDQTNNSVVSVVEFPDGHMSHFENREDLVKALLELVN